MRSGVGIESRQLEQRTPESLHEAEFTVFSQWGEDGIIDWLARTVPIERRLFVEFGVEDYRDANTRFLLEGRGWAGLVIDSASEHITRIVRSDLYWRHNLKAVTAFVTAENINSLLLDAGLQGDIGLLSVDIYGNDYWVWRAIDAVSPRIVVIEYNGLFGDTARVSVPYDPSFVLSTGPLLEPLLRGFTWGSRQPWSGQRLSAGGLQLDRLQRLRPQRHGRSRNRTGRCRGHAAPTFRQSRDRSGRLTFLTLEEEIREIADLPLVDVVSGEECTVSEVCNGPSRLRRNDL